MEANTSRLLPSGCDNQSALMNGSCEESRRGEVRSGRRELEYWVRIVLYALIFVLSVVGNALVIWVLAANRRLRTVTNCFLLSLAGSDLLLALVCMPFTLVPNLLGDFIFGAAMCKITAYFMGTSVTVSTLSLVAIALERYNAICKPLQSRAWQTRSHACRVIGLTWTLAALLMAPYPVYSRLAPLPRRDGTTAHLCRLAWPSLAAHRAWYVLLLLLLFVVPGVVMAGAYGMISRELYRGIRFELRQRQEAKAQACGGGGGVGGAGGGRDSLEDDDGCYVQAGRRRTSLEMSGPDRGRVRCSGGRGDGGRGDGGRVRCSGSESKLEGKKRVVRMLMVIVGMFFLCWMPLYTANTWRAFDHASATRVLSGAPISFIHLLTYTSACVNPLVYCFMNRRFRQAFLATLTRCLAPLRTLTTPNDQPTTTTGTSLSKFSYTTVSTVAGP